MGLRAVANTLLLFLALGFTLGAHAVLEFINTGTLSGWDGQSLDQGTDGTINPVTNVVRNGTTALKMTQTYIPSGYSGRYHAEVYRNEGYRRGQTKYYGFAFRLSQDWQFEPTQGYNIMQFIANFTDRSCDDGWMPSTMVWVRGDKISTRVKQGTLCAQHNEQYLDRATIQRGVWHRVVVGASWRSDSAGWFRMWLDGRLVVDEPGIQTTINEDRAFSFRVGLYANGWKDDNGMKGTQGFRQVWYDDIAIGNSYEDVRY